MKTSTACYTDEVLLKTFDTIMELVDNTEDIHARMGYLDGLARITWNELKYRARQKGAGNAKTS